MMPYRKFRLLMLCATMFFTVTTIHHACGQARSTSGIPIRFTLDRPGYVTLVIEDGAGNRICNLLGETYLPAGEQTVTWDGYDIGTLTEAGTRVRQRVAAGRYHVRGLVHDRITMRYEFAVNSPGTPPWFTRDGAGGWLADHTPPADIKSLPAGSVSPSGRGQAQFLVCSSSGESGDEFVWLNAEGRRLYGMNTGFWGATHLAIDQGKNAVPDTCAYAFMSGERDPDNNNLEVRAFKRNGDIQRVVNITFPMDLKKTTLPPFRTNAEAYGTNGLAVYDGMVVFSFTRQNRLIFADARRRTVLGAVDVNAPRDLLFDRQGRLYVISGKAVQRYAVVAGKAQLSGAETVISTGLEEPHRLALDAQGRLYVADWGRSHQIKVFTPDAAGHFRFTRAIGKPGGPQLGLYDEERMSNPAGMTIDAQGRLWVAEAELFPKRVSQWTVGGKFVRAWYGGPKYGGGGALDPQDKTRFYYADGERTGGTEFALDWARGTYRPKSIFLRTDLSNSEPMPGPAPECAFHVGGYTYLTNCYNGGLRFNQDRGIGIWRLDKDHIARPVVLIANAADMNNSIWGFPMRHKAAINALWKGEDPAHVMFLWCDKNHDGIAQPDEVQYLVTTRKNSNGEILGDMGLMPLVHADLSITTSYGTWIAPPTLDSHGTPLYDLRKQKVVGYPEWQRSPLVAGNWTLSQQDGVPALLGANLAGGARWRYLFTPEEHLGGPGLLVAPTRLLGPPFRPAVGQAGDMFAISGEMGTVFLFTMDGLFVQTLGGDNRTTPLWRMPEAKRGMLIDNVTFAQEHFHPTLTQTADGTIYLVAGHEQTSILKLEGWESVRQQDFGAVTVDAATLAALPPTLREEQPQSGRPTLTVALRDAGVRVDGDLADWPADTSWAQIDARASAALLFTHDRLYVACKTGDTNALANAGTEPINLFKYGGGLDLMIGPYSRSEADHNRTAPTAGDLRLLVTQVRGRTKAMLYRAVVPGTPEQKRTLFASPVGRVTFDQVADVSDQVELAQQGGDFEVSIPLAALGLTPHRGEPLLGDIGLLRGDGAQTTQRVYWSNHNTSIVSDIPSEARLQPDQWGLWNIK